MQSIGLLPPEVAPKARRSAMNDAITRFGLSQRRVCRITGWNRSSLQYQVQQRDDAAVRERLRHWAALKPRPIWT